jgi:hypothetical protein
MILQLLFVTLDQGLKAEYLLKAFLTLSSKENPASSLIAFLRASLSPSLSFLRSSLFLSRKLLKSFSVWLSYLGFMVISFFVITFGLSTITGVPTITPGQQSAIQKPTCVEHRCLGQ